AVELALRAFEMPEVDGVSLEKVIEAGERLPGMIALWDVATVEERRGMLGHIIQPEGLHYDVETKEIAAITPTPGFLPILRLLEGVVEYNEATGTLVTSRWQLRNRRESHYCQEVCVTIYQVGPSVQICLLGFYLSVRRVSIGTLLMSYIDRKST